MKEKNKVYDDQSKAIIMYRAIKGLQADFLNELKRQKVYSKFEKGMNDLFLKEKPGKRTISLIKIMMGQERPMNEKEKIDFAINETLSRQFQFVRQLDENYIPLTITIKGGIYRNSNKEVVYSLKKGRLKIIQTLLNLYTYCPSEDLRKAAEYLSIESLYNAVIEINNMAQIILGLPKGEKYPLIISESGKGYMLNELYPIEYEK